MASFLITLVVVLLALAGLGLGLFFGRHPPTGSCGGLACVTGATCAACPRHGKEGENNG